MGKLCSRKALLRSGYHWGMAHKHEKIPHRKKACQRSVADTVGTDYPTVNDLVVFYLVNFEVFCSSKVLENVSVVVSCRDFHNYPF